MHIRDERPSDTAAIRAVTAAAFLDAPHSDQTEPAIVEALRATGALSISLVAVEEDELVGHVAFSPVAIAHAIGDWFGLGPVSVRPDRQRRGIGQALIREGLRRLQAMQASGCVVLGAPAYYSRFGFESDPALWYGDAPAGYFQRLVFSGPTPTGKVSYHPSFG